MINAFQFSQPAGNHVFTLQSHDLFPYSGYPYTVTLRFQPSLNSDPPGSASWFTPSCIVVRPIASLVTRLDPRHTMDGTYLIECCVECRTVIDTVFATADIPSTTDRVMSNAL
jgi:hypothetical protein